MTKVAAGIASFALLSLAAAAWLREEPRGHARPRHAQRERDAELSPAAAGSGYWNFRATYPTGRFSSRWLVDAALQHERMAKGLPASRAANTRTRAGVLDPERVTPLGPAPLDAAPSYNFGLVGGRVNAILAHPTQTNVAWFGSDGGGIWKTTNCCSAATTWQPKTDSPTIANIAIGWLTLDPNDPDVLYAGTGDFRRNRPFTFGASGLLKSTDGGETWQVLGADVFNPVYSEPAGEFPQYRAISAVVVDPRDSARIAVGTNQGLYFSQDGGASWDGPCYTNAHATQRQDTTSLVAIDTPTGTDLIAAIGSIGRFSGVRYDLTENGANGLYRTAMPTGGCPASWTLISRPDNGWPAGTGSGIPYHESGGNPLRRLDVALAPSDPDTIYVQAMRMGVWRSTDGGASWSNVAVPPADFATGCVDDPYGMGYMFEDYNAGLLVSPASAQTLFLSSTDVWRSTDGGDTFTNLTCGYGEVAPGRAGNVHVDNHARAFVGGDPNRLLVGNDGGVYYSANALAAQPDFVATNLGTSTIEFYSGDITAYFDDPATRTRAIVGGAQDQGGANHVWSEGEVPGPAVWTLRSGGDGTYDRIEPVLGRRWYYNVTGYVTASTAGPGAEPDQLVSPQDEKTGELWQGDRFGFLMPLELYKFGGADTCPPATGCQRMLAGTYRVWESLSGGLPSTSWYPNSPDLTKQLPQDAYDLSIVNKVEFAYADPSRAVAGTNDGNVWFGFGLGGGSANPATWVDLTDANAVLPNRPVMDVAADPRTADVAYAALAGFDQNTPATPGHVYRVECSPGCASHVWTNRSGNLPNVPVNAILLNPHVPGQAFAGTDWGLYYTDDVDAPSPVWNRFDAGLPAAMIWDLVIDRGATTLAIFTRSRGAYVWPLPRGDLIFADGFEAR
jgi:hypothetical protein